MLNGFFDETPEEKKETKKIKPVHFHSEKQDSPNENNFFDFNDDPSYSLVDKLMIFQKALIENVATFRGSTTKQIDLMIESINKTLTSYNTNEDDI